MPPTSIQRIAGYIDCIHQHGRGLHSGDLSVETAENLLIMAECLSTACTAYLLKHETGGRHEAARPGHQP